MIRDHQFCAIYFFLYRHIYIIIIEMGLYHTLKCVWVQCTRILVLFLFFVFFFSFLNYKNLYIGWHYLCVAFIHADTQSRLLYCENEWWTFRQVEATTSEMKISEPEKRLYIVYTEIHSHQLMPRGGWDIIIFMSKTLPRAVGCVWFNGMIDRKLFRVSEFPAFIFLLFIYP